MTFKTIEECNLELIAYTQPDKPTSVSKHGVDYNGDFMPCSAARVSFSNEGKTGDDLAKDRKLMKYLADHRHTSCFEHQTATFLIECPLFIRSQIHRHRNFSYNEISRRYTDENLEFWVPDVFRKQSQSNKQASDGVIDDKTKNDHLFREYEHSALDARKLYEHLLECGVAREQARATLPQSLLTKFYMTGSLRNWQHFIELRRDEHAQKEVQIIAERVAEELRKLWPESCQALGI